MLEDFVNKRVAGGCDDCDAYQEITTDGSGIYVLAIYHDATCPYLNAREVTS